MKKGQQTVKESCITVRNKIERNRLLVSFSGTSRYALVSMNLKSLDPSISFYSNYELCSICSRITIKVSTFISWFFSDIYGKFPSGFVCAVFHHLTGMKNDRVLLWQCQIFEFLRTRLTRKYKNAGSINAHVTVMKMINKYFTYYMHWNKLFKGEFLFVMNKCQMLLHRPSLRFIVLECCSIRIGSKVLWMHCLKENFGNAFSPSLYAIRKSFLCKTFLNGKFAKLCNHGLRRS